jgi:pyruvyl transferase EpsO
MAASAYLASQDLPQQGGSESRGKIYLLIALCTALLLLQCTMTIAAYATKPATIESLPRTSVKHIPLDPEFEFNRLICLRKVQERVIQDIGAILVDGKPYVYLDIPMHMNLGDVWIWHGTHVALATHGQFPLVTDKKLERNITSARTQLGSDGIALWHGGGNFGDVWRGTSLIRNDAVQQLPNNKIVFLPQSLNYTKMQNVKHDNAIFQAHNKTLFMFRDYTSLQFSLENFPGKPVKYVPDMAFANGPQTPSANPIIDVILLLRRDKEATPHQKNESLNILRAANLTFEVWDFPVLGFPVKLEKDNKTLMYNYTTIYPKQRINIPYNNRHAFMGTRTQMANRLFSRGRLVITDRLHASIISTLMGKPVIYLDNIYKKITNVRGALANQFSECTDQNLHARHVETLVQAVKLAVQIFDGSVKM